jgi:hypothetical protein
MLAVILAVVIGSAMGCATMASKEWKANRPSDVNSLERFVMRHPHSYEAQIAKRSLASMYILSNAEIAKVQERRKRSERIDEPDLISKLIMAGADCLDDQANWTYERQGRFIYDTLRSCRSDLVVDSLRRVVVVAINRRRVLFLAVKLGLSGSEYALNDLLLSYGDKPMAEDYLNSGSRELHSGGAAWANRNGYRINTGPGSHRMRWGSF